MDTGIAIQGRPVAVGERVVYPNGGICKVQGVQVQQIAGREWRMLVLQREEDQAKVMVPREKVDTIGLRKVADPSAIRVLFEFLTASSADPELDWKVRHRENLEKMSAGGLLDTAQVLKGLHALARLRPLPQKERETYNSARHQLIGEIAVSLNLPPAVAENNIDYALTPPPGSGRKAPEDLPLDIKSLRRAIGGRGGGRGAGEFGIEGEEDDLLGLDGEDEAEEQAEPGETEEAAAGNEDVEAEETPAPPAAKAPPSKAQKPAAKKAEAKKPPPVSAKPAAKKAEAKQPAPVAAKPAANKAETKTPEGKKPEAKKPEGKKPEAKKPEAKKPEAKKPAPAKAAEKPAPTRKSVAKAPAAKAAIKKGAKK